MKYYLAIDIGASSGRHIIGWKENGKIETEELGRSRSGLSWNRNQLFGWRALLRNRRIPRQTQERWRDRYLTIIAGGKSSSAICCILVFAYLFLVVCVLKYFYILTCRWRNRQNRFQIRRYGNHAHIPQASSFYGWWYNYTSGARWRFEDWIRAEKLILLIKNGETLN